MNILPKKRWHVRTKDNIARVRRDEKIDAENKSKAEQQINLAKCEMRIKELRQKASVSNSEPESLSHVNLFYDLESGTNQSKKANAEHQKLKKEEQEDYEKKIGYLTYLGQDCAAKPYWFEKKPNERKTEAQINKDNYAKELIDPLNVIKKYTGVKYKLKSTSSSEEKPKKEDEERKHKTVSEKSMSKTKTLEEMRRERLKRENEEKIKQDVLLKRFCGTNDNATTVTEEKPKSNRRPIIQKYNSQFNPNIAKQNF